MTRAPTRTVVSPKKHGVSTIIAVVVSSYYIMIILCERYCVIIQYDRTEVERPAAEEILWSCRRRLYRLPERYARI